MIDCNSLRRNAINEVCIDRLLQKSTLRKNLFLTISYPAASKQTKDPKGTLHCNSYRPEHTCKEKVLKKITVLGEGKHQLGENPRSQVGTEHLHTSLQSEAGLEPGSTGVKAREDTDIKPSPL